MRPGGRRSFGSVHKKKGKKKKDYSRVSRSPDLYEQQRQRDQKAREASALRREIEGIQQEQRELDEERRSNRRHIEQHEQHDRTKRERAHYEQEVARQKAAEARDKPYGEKLRERAKAQTLSEREDVLSWARQRSPPNVELQNIREKKRSEEQGI